MTIAQTILQQLGGNRFIAMTGAKNLGDTGRGLQMQVMGGLYVVVTLDESDTYTVESFKLRKFERTGSKIAHNVYADSLRATFTDQTGLETSL